MSRTIFVLLFFSYTLITATGSIATNPTQSVKTEVRFKLGQMWSY